MESSVEAGRPLTGIVQVGNAGACDLSGYTSSGKVKKWLDSGCFVNVGSVLSQSFS